MATQGPLYLRIQNELADRIRKEYRLGDLLPTQVEIARKTGTSLITVRRAMSELARLGLIESVPGRGSIVKRPTVTEFRGGISSWTHSVGNSGERPQTIWTRIEERMPEPRIRRLLDLARREQTVCVRRLRAIRGQPISLMTNELPGRLIPGLVDAGLRGESLYECLRREYGLAPDRASEEVIARLCTDDERQFLGQDASVVLSVERITVQKNGEPLEVSQSVNRGDLYRYQVQLLANTGNIDNAPAHPRRNGRAANRRATFDLVE